MRKKSKKLATLPINAWIEKFSHDGRGIARINGKTTFVHNALPDETVVLQYTRNKRDFDEAKVVSVLKPSVHRVLPRCLHYGLCGGCSLQHLDAYAQIHIKQELLLDILVRIAHLRPATMLPPLSGDLWFYRNKARLSVFKSSHGVMLGFRERHEPGHVADINECVVLNARINLSNLRCMLNTLDSPEAIAQIEVAVGDDDVALIFRNLASLSVNDELRLKAFAHATNFRIFLQPGNAKSIYLFYPQDGCDLLSYKHLADDIEIWFHPSDFIQINAGLNRLMVQQALQLLALEPQDVVLDLFCGLGNFTLPIAKHCDRVIGVEGNDAMVMRARMNAKINGLVNTEFLCANLEEDVVYAGFKDMGITKALIDPPRSGAFGLIKHISQLGIKSLVYVSCNPATLARDADLLVNTYGFKMAAVGVMDMFPHTAHVESIALFVSSD